MDWTERANRTAAALANGESNLRRRHMYVKTGNASPPQYSCPLYLPRTPGNALIPAYTMASTGLFNVRHQVGAYSRRTALSARIPLRPILRSSAHLLRGLP